MIILLSITYLFHLIPADSHLLKYCITVVTPGTGFPEFIVTGELDFMQVEYYDSIIKELIPKTDLLKSCMGEEYWKKETQKWQKDQLFHQNFLKSYMKHHNHTVGLHTFQEIIICRQEDPGKTESSCPYAYDGEDVNSAFPEAESKYDTQDITMFKDEDSNTIPNDNCIDTLKKYLNCGKSISERRVPPSVAVFQRNSSSPVVCHATGFFPKEVSISWQKDGEDIYEDVELNETLPNQDDTFQKRSYLKVSPEELDKNNYTCVVQHISLDHKIVIEVNKRRGPGTLIGIIFGIAVPLCIFVGCFIYKNRKKRPESESSMELNVRSRQSSVLNVTYSSMNSTAESSTHTI